MNVNNNQLSNNIPGFEFNVDGGFNPTMRSELSPYELPFYQTRDTLIDVDTYKKFLDNAVSRARHSRTYKGYKSTLIDLGMDRCQYHGNITTEMATVEMHHNILTMFDIAYIITEHTLNTKGYISTFDLVQRIKEVHKEHKVQLVMMTLTPHQLFHNTEGMFIHPKMCFGDWVSFLQEYNKGISVDIATKIIVYLDESAKTDQSYDSNLLDLRKNLIDWSEYNVINYS